MKKQISRGLRNCNPLNIKKGGGLFQGLAAEQTDPVFYRFKSMAWGYRAAFVTLRTYIEKHGVCTVRTIISRWAPPGDQNDTEYYIKMVCCLTGFKPDDTMNAYNREQMVPLVCAMSRIENGERARVKDVLEGWDRYMG